MNAGALYMQSVQEFKNNERKVIIETCKIIAKVAFTSLAYGLIAKVWKM